MYVYNQTVNIDETVCEKWLKWMRGTIIPKIANSPSIDKVVVFKVLVNEEMGGITYSTQFFIKNKEDLQSFYKVYQTELKQQMAIEFPNQFVTFETELQLIDEIK